MRKLGFILVLLIGGCVAEGYSQNADQRVDDCIARQDWFALEAEYPLLRDSLSNTTLKWFSQAMLGICFNRSGEALTAIDTLLIHYQVEIGASNIVSMVYFKALLLERQGRYKEAADWLENFLLQASSGKRGEELEGIIRYYGYLKELRGERPPVLKRPKREVVVPATIKKAGRGDHLFIPVKVHGKEYPFIFDTGAEKSFLSKRYADLLGARVVYDSLTINGVGGSSLGGLGIIDRIEIGKIVYKNVVVAIAPDDPEVDSVYEVNAVLGCDFMRAVGEIHLCPKEKKIVFPFLSSSDPGVRKNMMCNFIIPYVEGISEDEKLVFQFDTGNVSSDLSFSYYEKHKERVAHYGIPDVIHSGGFGGMQTFRVYRLKNFPLRIGNVDLEMKNLNVNADALLPIQKNEDGALGMSFIQEFEKVVINFKDMFLKVVK